MAAEAKTGGVERCEEAIVAAAGVTTGACSLSACCNTDSVADGHNIQAVILGNDRDEEGVTVARGAAERVESGHDDNGHGDNDRDDSDHDGEPAQTKRRRRREGGDKRTNRPPAGAEAAEEGAAGEALLERFVCGDNPNAVNEIEASRGSKPPPAPRKRSFSDSSVSWINANSNNAAHTGTQSLSRPTSRSTDANEAGNGDAGDADFIDIKIVLEDPLGLSLFRRQVGRGIRGGGVR